MAKPELQPFYRTQAWQKCRNAYAKARGGLCERCLERGLYVAGEIVHHKQHLTAETVGDPAVSLNWDNLQLLCRDCHGDVHRSMERRYKVDSSGKVVGR